MSWPQGKDEILHYDEMQEGNEEMKGFRSCMDLVPLIFFHSRFLSLDHLVYSPHFIVMKNFFLALGPQHW